jgi:hypothetical protein
MYDGAIEVKHAWWVNLGMSCSLILLFPFGGCMGDVATDWYYGPENERDLSTERKCGTKGFRFVMMIGAVVMMLSGRL